MSERPLCECGRGCERGSNKVDGVKKTYWRTKCQKCRNGKNNKPASYRIHKKDKCEECGFVPVDKCQLDVDHVDGNHSNNSIENLQTLCANCHRLKTHKNRDYLSKV